MDADTALHDRATFTAMAEGTPEDWRVEVSEVMAGTTRGATEGRRRAAPVRARY